MEQTKEKLSEILHIIVVEDQVADMLVIEKAFGKLDIPVILHLYNDGLEAINDIKQSASLLKPDLIITDLKMPKKDGKTFIREIRQIEGLSDVPVAVLSGFTEEFSKQDEQLQHKIAAVLIKSELYSDMENFVKVINNLCRNL